MTVRLINALAGLLLMLSWPLWASSLTDIRVNNAAGEAVVTLSFSGQPVYEYFSLDNPSRVVIDISQSGVIKGLPLVFNGQNLISRIRSSNAKDPKSLRLVLDLTQKVQVKSAKEGNGAVFTLTGERKPTARKPAVQSAQPSAQAGRNPFVPQSSSAAVAAAPTRVSGRAGNGEKIIVAIDAGHGGQDPGGFRPRGAA